MNSMPLHTFPKIVYEDLYDQLINVTFVSGNTAVDKIWPIWAISKFWNGANDASRARPIFIVDAISVESLDTFNRSLFSIASDTVYRNEDLSYEVLIELTIFISKFLVSRDRKEIIDTLLKAARIKFVTKYKTYKKIEEIIEAINKSPEENKDSIINGLKITHAKSKSLEYMMTLVECIP